MDSNIVEKASKKGFEIMKYEFDAEIKRLEGKIQWSVFYFAKSAADCFGTKGNIPVWELIKKEVQ